MASPLNPPSTPTTSHRKNNRVHPPHSHTTSTTGADYSSFKSETCHDVDLSWLPDYDDNRCTSKSDHDHSHHETGQDDEFDDSWLPNYNDTKKNATSETPSKSNNLNLVRKTQNGNKNHDHDDSWLPNYSSKTPSKSNTLNRSQSQKTNGSSFPTAHIVINNGNINSENKKKHTEVSNKKPESSTSQGQVPPCKSEYLVETDSLGGVSTLLRRWKDLVETTNSNNTTTSSKSGSGLAEKNKNNPSWKDYAASKKCASSTTTNDSFVDLESCKTSPSTPLTSRVIKDSKAFDAENDKIRVMNIINKLSREEVLAAGNTNESFTRIANASDHQPQAARENKCLSRVIGSTRWIHGSCEVFKEFLSLKEQDKQYELETLAQSKPVTEFSHRSHIKALLHVRFTWLEAESETEGGKQDASPEFHVHNRADYDQNEMDDDEKSSNHKQALENSCQYWVLSEWEEDDDDEGYYTHDWISEIARPRSEWEHMRQARYREMLYLFACNRDIQELLKRRCVSSFLSSDQLRGKIDKLMISRAEGHLHEEAGGR